MTIEEKNYMTLSFPIPKSVQRQLKTIAAAQGKTIRTFFVELCLEDIFQRPENKKLLAGLK